MKKTLILLPLFGLLQITAQANPVFKKINFLMTSEIKTVMMINEASIASQSNKTKTKMDTTIKNTHSKKAATVYLDKTDPKFISIKARVFSDMFEVVQDFDPESERNKLIDIQTKTWTKEMRNECQDLGTESINNYVKVTHSDAGMFMMVITSIGAIEQKRLEKEWQLRIQSMGGGKYVAEFWEDGLAVNSEENAVAYAHELAVSGYAKKHPGSDVGNVEEIKKNYANTRKIINTGEQVRYQKMMALLYSADGGGTVSFINPYQPAKDFLKKNSK